MINKQSIKQFLKPNKRKILVFVIFGIILLFCPIIHCDIYYGALPPDERWQQTTICSPLECVLGSDTISRIIYRISGGSGDCLWSSIGLIYFLSYILSCFVILLYDKLKITKL